MAGFLAERDHEVTVLCAEQWGGEVVEFKQDGVTYHRVTDVPAVSSFTSRIPFAPREVSPDVTQVASYPPWHVTVIRAVAWFLRTPVVANWWTRNDRGGSQAYRRVVKPPNAVLVPSEMVHAQVREPGTAVDSTRLVPEPISVDLARSADADERVGVAYVRNLGGHAGVESFLLALMELRDENWSAVVIGDGPERLMAEQTARDPRIDSRIEFLGKLSANEAVPIMRGTHVFAQAATVGPFATNLLWVFACGCVSTVEYQVWPSAHELVEGHERGPLVASPQELVDEIAAAHRYDHGTVDDGFARYGFRQIIEQYESVYGAERSDYSFF